MVKLNCEYCNIEIETYPSWAKTKRFCSRSCHGKWTAENKKGSGIFVNNKGKSWEELYGKEGAKKKREKRALQVMEKGANWKGGITINWFGYRLVKLPTHSRADKNGYVREHILVMEKYLDRNLNKKEVIHHINGNKSDNRPENLRIFTNHSEHIKYHGFNKGKKYWGSNAHLNVEATK